jgi:hypothetical protein
VQQTNTSRPLAFAALWQILRPRGAKHKRLDGFICLYATGGVLWAAASRGRAIEETRAAPAFELRRRRGHIELAAMQPTYLTLASTGSSPWKTANWDATPQQIAFAVLSTGGSSWFVSVTFEDPSLTYPSPNSSTPTGFTILTGSSNQFVTLGSSVAPIAGYQFTLNSQSSAGARVTCAVLQSGID